MSTLERELTQGKKAVSRIELVGLIMVALSIFGLLVNPGFIAGIFNAMVERTVPVIVNVYITGTLGVTIILSVVTGRILERLGFTDALIRIFTPITKLMGINPTVVIPAVYNILGDINAAGRITGPTLKRAKATKDEQKIAIATMIQSQQSFSTFMLGMLAMTAAGIKVFPVIVIAVFLPLVVVPWLLSRTIYRNTEAKSLVHIDRFTPTTGALPTLFGAAREGAELLFLLLIPAAAAIFAIIGALNYIGIWGPIEQGLTAALTALSIDPQTGIQSILVSPTLAMNTLKDTAATLNPKLVIGSFVLASSGFPLQVIVGQVPAIWASGSDLTEREAMEAAVLGAVMRIVTAFILALVLTPLVS
ncbi:hypothetical protein [Zhaonella formicivorans]|uniref:hypothetical protein n=1 Tax=Zhaonella formicivorans TaxID=2528593 RepID=UPI0010CE1B9A|nr:hypothetical protein [Zhaonella formicivorans]